MSATILVYRPHAWVRRIQVEGGPKGEVVKFADYQRKPRGDPPDLVFEEAVVALETLADQKAVAYLEAEDSILYRDASFEERRELVEETSKWLLRAAAGEPEDSIFSSSYFPPG